MKYYFITGTWWTLFSGLVYSGCWCNRLLNWVPFTYKKICFECSDTLNLSKFNLYALILTLIFLITMPSLISPVGAWSVLCGQRRQSPHQQPLLGRIRVTICLWCHGRRLQVGHVRWRSPRPRSKVNLPCHTQGCVFRRSSELWVLSYFGWDFFFWGGGREIDPYDL